MATLLLCVILLTWFSLQKSSHDAWWYSGQCVCSHHICHKHSLRNCLRQSGLHLHRLTYLSIYCLIQRGVGWVKGGTPSCWPSLESNMCTHIILSSFKRYISILTNHSIHTFLPLSIYLSEKAHCIAYNVCPHCNLDFCPFPFWGLFLIKVDYQRIHAIGMYEVGFCLQLLEQFAQLVQQLLSVPFGALLYLFISFFFFFFHCCFRT